MPAESAEFDDRLRQVTPPVGMTSRLRAIPDWSDADLDAQLSAVDLPPELLTNLHGIVEYTQLDEALRSVPVPRVALARARVVADQRKPLLHNAPEWLQGRVVQWAIAASLIMLTWSGYLSAIVSFAGSSAPEPAAEKIIWIDQSPLQLAARQPAASAALIEQPWESPLIALAGEYEVPEPIEPDLPAELARVARAYPLEEMQADLARAGEAMYRDQFELAWESLNGQSPAAAAQADWSLATVTPASTSAALWQTDLTQPHLFMVDRSPVFSPGNDSRLETSEPPLSPHTTTFDWASAMAAAGRYPTGESLQVADFLAALDYDSLKLSPGEVEWEVNTTVSANGLRHNGIRPIILQAALQAGSMQRPDSTPVNIQLAVDTSASMSAGRLETVRLALDRLFSGLREQDRAQLLPFAQQPGTASPWLAPAQGSRWHDRLTSLSASTADTEQGADWGLALQAALAQAIERAERTDGSRLRVVLISDSQSLAEPARGAALELLAERAKAHAIEVHAIHMGASGQTRQLLTTLCESTGGQCVAAAKSAEVYRTLTAIAAGAEATLARNVSLKIHFDPKQVAAYRLLGDHAPSIVAAGTDQSVSLAAGQSLTAIYEIWLRPDAKGSPFTVEAQWKNVTSGKLVRRKKSFTVSELAAEASAAPAQSLWLASLAIATTDALRSVGSPAQARERIEQVLQVARGGSSTVVNRADVRRMIRLLEESREALVPAER